MIDASSLITFTFVLNKFSYNFFSCLNQITWLSYQFYMNKNMKLPWANCNPNHQFMIMIEQSTAKQSKSNPFDSLIKNQWIKWFDRITWLRWCWSIIFQLIHSEKIRKFINFITWFWYFIFPISSFSSCYILFDFDFIF